MRRASTLIFLLLAISLSSLAQMRLQPAPSPASKLIRAGRVLDVKSGRYLLDQGILTEGERIKEIGLWSDVQAHAPRDIAMIDLGQATLLPGLIDCHAHLLISGDLGRLDPGELLTTTLTQTSPSLRALLGARNAKEDLEAGITSARIVGHSGIDGDVALRDAINAGWISGPRLQAAGRKITGIGGQATTLQSAVAAQILAQEFLTVSGPDQARAAVRENLAIGADLIKIVVDSDAGRNWKTRYMPVEDGKAIVEDAHRLGMKVAAHAGDNVAVQTAIDAGVDSIEHAWTATDEQLKQMKDRGIFLVATEIFVAAAPKDRLQRAMRIGVKIAMGSDAWALLPGKTRGEATLVELKRLQDEGMPGIDIIRSSTMIAAELMGWPDRVGELAAGKFADIIAVEGDPVQDIGLLQHVQFVMKGATVVRNDFARR
ncbi:MAG TPA: amidohydrolase family protein [Blastocatellia bacterium]|nr:amidohydrolase family protein [Blastocatellia bacterium]